MRQCCLSSKGKGVDYKHAGHTPEVKVFCVFGLIGSFPAENDTKSNVAGPKTNQEKRAE
jgi:hypothetical protein